jgi:hypothetical protein
VLYRTINCEADAIERCETLCIYLPQTTVYISTQEGTGGICPLGDVIDVFVPSEIVTKSKS